MAGHVSERGFCVLQSLLLGADLASGVTFLGLRVCGGCRKVVHGQVQLQQCGGCHLTLYCSAACQKAHRPVHKAACSGGDSASPGGELYRPPMDPLDGIMTAAAYRLVAKSPLKAATP
jgi:hypothetical protein